VNCPFCDEEIKDKALVCKHCGRDLSLLRPVLDRFQEMENRLAAVEEVLHTLGAHVDAVKSGHTTAQAPKVLTGALLPYLLPAAAIILLIASHWLIIVILDINPWILRLVSILLPLPFGWFHARSVKATIAAAVVIATVAILPQTSRDWLEIAEYAASIGLSYLTGSLLGGWMKSRRDLAKDETSLVYEIAAVLASKSAPKGEARAKVKLRIETIVNYLNIVAVLVTAAGSITTGILKFLVSSTP